MQPSLNKIKRPARQLQLPFIVKLIVIATIIACIGGEGVLGYRVSGLTWFIPFVISLYTVFARLGKISFPEIIWMPWVLLILINLLLSDYSGLQRTIQLVCPLIIGMAVSSYTYQERQLVDFLRWCEYAALALSVITVIKTGIIFTGQIPEVTGLAAEVMTGMLLSSIFAARYVLENEKYIKWLAILAIIPVIALTRTAIVATGLTLPLTLAPLKMTKRAGFIILVAIAGLLLFQTERVQKKMFFSGQGEMSDVLSEDFKSTGRFLMWERFRSAIEQKPWFGYGAGTGELFTREITNGISGYPHNDWLLTQYDYGYVGASIFAVSLLAASMHAYHKARRTSSPASILFYAGASSFISFIMLMYTDNIMVYASFFGNLQFTILGVAYGSVRDQPQRTRKLRIRW